MTYAQAILWTIFSALIGGAIVAYLIFSIPPTALNGDPDIPALLLFFVGFGTLCFGLCSLVALMLHRRWPALAGAATRATLRSSAALRQGLLLAVGLVVLALLAMLGFFDIAFVLITLILIGLVEAFIQNRD